MSLYNRESVVRRHNGVFTRGHHPVKEEGESTLESLQLGDTLTQDNGTRETVGNELTSISSSTTLPTSSPAVNSDTLSSSPASAITSSSLHPSSIESVSKPVVTSSSSSALPVGAASSQAPVVTSSKGGLSSGAIGAVVTLIILLVVAIAAFAIRKFYIHRREFKRNTWGAGLVPALQTKRSTIYGDEKKASLPAMEQREKSAPALLTAPPSFASSPKMPSPPPLSYNSIPSPTSAVSPVQATSPSRSTTQKAELAVVVRTFIPSLPDELNITTGEHIRILTRYDDGWALCSNIRNEQGVVPLECLQRADATAALQLQPQSEFGYGSDKSTKRLSSLTPNNDGTY